jgi:type VI protein secretion system component Hcp
MLRAPGPKQRATNRSHIADATITLRKTGQDQQEYLLIKLTDTLVTSVSTSLSADDYRRRFGPPSSVAENPRSEGGRRRLSRSEAAVVPT